METWSRGVLLNKSMPAQGAFDLLAYPPPSVATSLSHSSDRVVVYWDGVKLPASMIVPVLP